MCTPTLASHPFGDSGQQDPGVYSEFANRHPAMVKHLFIREVAGIGKPKEPPPGVIWFREAAEIDARLFDQEAADLAPRPGQ